MKKKLDHIQHSIALGAETATCIVVELGFRASNKEQMKDDLIKELHILNYMLSYFINNLPNKFNINQFNPIIDPAEIIRLDLNIKESLLQIIDDNKKTELGAWMRLGYNIKMALFSWRLDRSMVEDLLAQAERSMIHLGFTKKDKSEIITLVRSEFLDFKDADMTFIFNPMLSVAGELLKQKENIKESRVVLMGDHTHLHGNNNILVNRSTVQNAFNKVKNEHDEEIAKALTQIEEEINNSGNKEAAENFEAFSDELSRPKPKKSLLKTLWQGTLTALPKLKESADIVEKIVKLFSI